MGQITFNSEEILEQLKNEILTLQLKPGETLGENKLCQRFCVSRTPIRAVLRRLEAFGLVSIVPYKGTSITLLDFEEIKQIIYMRMAIETMVLKDFIKICTPMILERLRYIIRQQHILVENSGHVEDFYKLDSKLHEIWFYETDKMYLWNLLQQSQVQYTRFRMLDILESCHISEIIKEHEQLFSMIEASDSQGIEDFIKHHLYGGINRVYSKINTYYSDYFVKH